MITKREAIASAVTVRRDRHISHSANFIRLNVRPSRTRVRLICTWMRDARTGRLSCRWQEEPPADLNDASPPWRARAAGARTTHPRPSSVRLPHDLAAARAERESDENPVIRPRAFAM